MKGMTITLMLLWGALLAAIAGDSFGIERGSWFDPLGLGLIPELWKMASDYITQYIWGGVAWFGFWIGTSMLMFRPAVLERLFTKKINVNV